MKFSPLERSFPCPKSPFYLYSEERLETLIEHFFRALTAVKSLHVHFALKSNHNPDLLARFKSYGFGLDLVSGGELRYARTRGFEPKDLILSGVGKSNEELELALDEKIDLIIVESRSELERLGQIAAKKKTPVRIAFRVNPDVDAKTHPYISTGLHEHKFGIDFDEARELYRLAQKNEFLKVSAMSVHIGSQMLELSALDSALEKSLELCRELKEAGISIEIFDVGGGLGVPYHSPLEIPPFEKYGEILSHFEKSWLALQGPKAKIYCELGRALVAQAGFLVTRVLGLKKTVEKNFAIVDASMTELLRPALYQAEHPIELWDEPAAGGAQGSRKKVLYDVVGPVCESSDVLGRKRELPELHEGDVLLISCAGAYGYVMSSTYNLRPLPAEYWLTKSGVLQLSRPSRDPF